MKVWLADTGPLVALLVAGENNHAWAVDRLREAPPTVLTCDAVVTEALFLLKRAGHDGGLLFDLMETGFLRSVFDLQAEYGAVRELMRRYRETPMSFADACLVRMAELEDTACIWTLDRDFSIYRKHRRQTLSLVTPW